MICTLYHRAKHHAGPRRKLSPVWEGVTIYGTVVDHLGECVIPAESDARCVTAFARSESRYEFLVPRVRTY
jgi:hypothetical protein